MPELAPDAGAVFTLGRSTVRAFDFSVTPEEGWLTAVTVEGRRYTRAIEGSPGVRGYVRVAGRTQAYRPLPWGGFARHVVAGRLLAAADVGSRSPGFAVGGLYGGGIATPLSAGLGIGGELDFPVRGYGEGAQLGDRALAGSLEYRFPIALVEKGYRLIPLFLDRVWGTAFADGGARVVPGRLPARALTDSRGAAAVLRGRGAGARLHRVLLRQHPGDGRRRAPPERGGPGGEPRAAGRGVLRAVRAVVLTAERRGTGDRLQGTASNCG